MNHPFTRTFGDLFDGGVPATFLLVTISALAALTGCGRSDTVAEGIIYSVEYEKPGGGAQGFTRLNEAKAVPGGNGSWNVDARGKLTRQFLIITRPQRADQGQLVIPVSYLHNVQFGDGGIKKVNESKSKAPN